jgi:hypothetical protein
MGLAFGKAEPYRTAGRQSRKRKVLEAVTRSHATKLAGVVFTLQNQIGPLFPSLGFSLQLKREATDEPQRRARFYSANLANSF